MVPINYDGLFKLQLKMNVFIRYLMISGELKRIENTDNDGYLYDISIAYNPKYGDDEYRLYKLISNIKVKIINCSYTKIIIFD